MISVVIPARNAAQTLPRCLAALRQQTRLPDEVIVIDDGSTDATGAIASEWGARCLQTPAKGPAVARNVGARAAIGEFLLFTDADCEPLSDWVAQMVAPFSDPSVMGVKGTYRSRQTQWVARLVQVEFEEKYDRMRRLPTIDFIDTYSAAYRREVFLTVGGFNETFPTASVEDVELSFRLAEQGVRLVFAPAAQVWHQHPISLSYYLRRKARYGFWRALVYLWHPGKIRGDSHTDPSLKVQFLLVALGGFLAVLGLLTPWALGLSGVCWLGLGATTLPFAARAWKRDKTVALLIPPVYGLRVIVQAGALGVGLLAHGLARLGVPILAEKLKPFREL